MKTKSIVALAVGVALAAQADPATIAKQRAKELNNQNNVRQGIGAPASPVAPAKPAPTRPAQPQPPDPVAKLKADIAAITGKPSVPAELKQQFTADLHAAARGSRKPSNAAVEKLSASLASALAGQPLESSAQSRLAQDINLALNSASLSPQRAGEIADDVQAILQTGGIARGTAAKVADDLKAIAAELRDSAK
jgi:hypothetical protein